MDRDAGPHPGGVRGGVRARAVARGHRPSPLSVARGARRAERDQTANLRSSRQDPLTAPHMSTKRFLLWMLLLFTVLTAVMTYPQVFHIADGVHDDGDPLMVTWVLGWVCHQLPRAPAHIFDANIFYPERNTLAYSETMLVPGTIVAPLYWLGVGPILIYNLVFLSGFALSGVGVALLVRRLTGSVGAAILAGIVFAFPPRSEEHT